MHTWLQERILSVLRYGDKNRSQLVEALETPRTTIYDHIVVLEKEKLVERYKKGNGKRGHPIVYWSLVDGGSKQ